MLKHNTLAAEHHRQSLQTRQPPFITLEESGGGFDQVQQSLTLETLDRGLEKEQTDTDREGVTRPGSIPRFQPQPT